MASLLFFWPAVTRPLLGALGPKVIVDIGAGQGEHTRALLGWCKEHGTILHSIDTLRRFDWDALAAQHAQWRPHQGRSEDVLPKIGDCDLAVIDGDHNWHTVSQELTLLGNRERPPLILLHDVGWPYARRDLYYDPDTIPAGARHAMLRGGMLPGSAAPVAGRGLNAGEMHALEEGTPRNGILTAVEDFLATRGDAWEWIRLDVYFGFGLLAPRRLLAENAALRELFAGLRPTPQLSGLLSVTEADRILHAVDALTTRNAYKDLEREAQALWHDCEALRGSRSWRWTEPLRRLEGALRSTPKISRPSSAPAAQPDTTMQCAPAIPLQDTIAYGIIGMLSRLWIGSGRPFAKTLRRIRHRWLGARWPATGGAPPMAVMPAAETFWRDVTVRGGGRKTVRVAVVIPCHNYGQFLAEAIDSVLDQTCRPAEIIVVNDASTDDTSAVAARYADRGVRYVHGNWQSVACTRNEGARATQSPFLVFLDADDRLPPEYLERCLSEMRDDRVALTYGDMRRFGESQAYQRMPEFNRDELLRQNYISSHAMIRRIAYDLVGGYRETENAHQDWDLYRRILSYTSWTAKKAHTYVEYRVRSGSMLQKYSGSSQDTYARRAALLRNPVTIFTPFAGRTYALEPYLRGLRSLTFDPSLLRVRWFNTSPDPKFAKLLKDAAATLSVGTITRELAPLPDSWRHTPDSLIEHRVDGGMGARYFYQMVLVYAYNHLLRACDTEYALVVEDDIVLAPDTVERLMALMDLDVVATVATYRCRFEGDWSVWTRKNGIPEFHVKRKAGVSEIDGAGFGCSLFRMSALRRNPITFAGDGPGRWYDHVAFGHLREQGRVLCDWDLDIDHLQAPVTPR